MSSYMQVEAFDVEPFVLIHELDKDQAPLRTFTIAPGVPAAPRRVKFSKNKEQMVAVADLRVEYEESIGGPGDTSEVGGIRVFSPADDWIFLGGTGTTIDEWPRFYQRRGPGFIEYPKRPLGVQVGPTFMPHLDLQKPKAHAVFDKTGTIIMLADGVDGDGATFYKFDGSQWIYIGATDYWADAATNRLMYDPTHEIFVIQVPYVDAPNNSVVFYTHNGDVGGPARIDNSKYFRDGRLVAISPDGRHWVFMQGNASSEPLLVCQWTGDELLPAFELPGSEGSSRQGFFLPDGSMFIVLGTANSGFDMPIWFSVTDDVFTLTGGRNYEVSAGQFKGLASLDSSKVLVWSDTRLVLYEPGEFVGDELADAADKLGITATRPTTAVPFAISKDGRYVFTKTSTTHNRYFWNGTAFVTTSTSGFTTLLNTGATGFAISPDGEYYVMGGLEAGSPNRHLQFVKRNSGSDTAFTRLPFASFPPVADCPVASNIVNMDFSPSGDHVVVITNLTPYVWMYKRTGDVFSRITAIPTLAGPPNDAKFSPDGTHLILASPLAMWKRSGDTYVTLDAPDIAGTGVDVAWAPDGNKFGLASSSGITFYRRLNDSLYRLDLVPSQTPYAGSQQVAWTPDSKYAFIGRNGAGAVTPFLRAVRFGDDDDYEEVPLTGLTLPTAGIVGLGVQPGTNYVIAYAGGSATIRYYQYTALEGLLTLHEKYATGAVSPNFIDHGALTADGGIMHFDRGSVGEHRETVTFTPVQQLAFDTQADPPDVTDILYGNTGNYVLYERDGKNGLAVRPPNSDYINIRDLRGTFVTLYDQAGLVYQERAYAMHPVGAKVTDIQISETPVSFSYNLQLAEDLVQNARVGRLIYDIRDGAFLDMGAVYRIGDASSLFAYSPWENYFVNVTLNTEDGESAIRLFKMDDTVSPITFAQVDVEEVLYGPPSYSRCDTVAVAHGGPIPFTLFARVVDELVYREIEIVDWQSEEFVLAVDFTEDCSALLIVLPDKVVVVEEDPEDPTKWTPEDEMPIDPIDEEDGETDIEIDDDLVIITNPDLPEEPPTLGDLDPDDKSLDDITYLPYVSVSVTYRTW